MKTRIIITYEYIRTANGHTPMSDVFVWSWQEVPKKREKTNEMKEGLTMFDLCKIVPQMYDQRYVEAESAAPPSI